MSDVKKDEKGMTYTKDELSKFKVDAVQTAKDDVMVYDMGRTWHPLGGKLTPRFRLDVHGDEAFMRLL